MKIFFSLMGITSIILISQSLHAQSTESVKRNTIYAELSSKKPVYSLNYDRVFHSGAQLCWSYRAGVHILGDEVGVPVGLNMFTGSNVNHHAEFGVSVMPYIDRINYLFRDGNISDKYIYITPGAGYRYQRPGGGFFLKALIAPQIVLDPRSDDFWRMDPVTYFIASVGGGYSF